jgi:hypothetical protein
MTGGADIVFKSLNRSNGIESHCSRIRDGSGARQFFHYACGLWVSGFEPRVCAKCGGEEICDTPRAYRRRRARSILNIRCSL